MIQESGGYDYESLPAITQDLTFDYSSKLFREADIAFNAPQQKTLGLILEDGTHSNLAMLLSDQCPHTPKFALFEGLMGMGHRSDGGE